MEAHMRGAALIVAGGLLAFNGQTASTDIYVPARLVDGPKPAVPGERTPNGGIAGATILGGGEVLLEVSVAKTGEVAGVERIRVTPPYTDLVTTAVESLRFLPAESASAREPRHAIESRVLVAAVYRPPALYNGATLGEPPKDLVRPSSLIPLPHELIAPPYPVNARGSETVLLEVDVSPDGSSRNARVVHSGGGFDSAAIQAAERWTFTPARLPDGANIPSFAYIVMGFREPVVGGR
jgi:TonB family protein